jgi:hypothetical protein
MLPVSENANRIAKQKTAIRRITHGEPMTRAAHPKNYAAVSMAHNEKPSRGRKASRAPAW